MATLPENKEHPALPDTIDPIHMLLQPIDGEQHTPHTEREEQFWSAFVLEIDQKLAHRADKGRPETTSESMPDVSLEREKPAITTKTINDNINKLIRKTLNDSSGALYFGFTHGIMPQLADVYNDPFLAQKAKQRVFTATVTGKQGDTHGKTRVRSELPEEAIQEATCIIVHDDVADKIAALAAFVEKIYAIKFHQDCNYGLVDQLITPNLTDEEKIPLYRTLIDMMRTLRVAAAIPVYKNALFYEMLKTEIYSQAINQEDADYLNTQAVLLNESFLPKKPKWFMGDGMDTDIAVKTIYENLPEELRDHPAVAALFTTTMNSKIRLGSTIKGIIALEQYEGNPDRAMNDLQKFVVAHIEKYLSWYKDGYTAS